jgi:hypothetical protein
MNFLCTYSPVCGFSLVINRGPNKGGLPRQCQSLSTRTPRVDHLIMQYGGFG